MDNEVVLGLLIYSLSMISHLPHLMRLNLVEHEEKPDPSWIHSTRQVLRIE